MTRLPKAIWNEWTNKSREKKSDKEESVNGGTNYFSGIDRFVEILKINSPF